MNHGQMLDNVGFVSPLGKFISTKIKQKRVKFMIHETEASYIAGLFDGEGSIHFKRSPEKKKKHRGKPGYRMSNSLRCSMEITMTDKSVLTWVHEVLGVGTLTDKPRKGERVDGTPYLKQYRWRCTFRDAYYVCLLIWPFAHVKLEKITKIIDHYTGQNWAMKHDNIVSLNKYRQWKQLNAKTQ